MAHDNAAFADLVADTLDVLDTDVSDVLNASPYVAQMPVIDSSNGDVHKFSVNTGAPVVAFRSENAGKDIDHSIDAVTTLNLKILDGSFWVDRAVAQSWQKGGVEGYIGREMSRALRSLMFKIEQQVFQGTNADAAGFDGFEDSTNLDALADTMTIDAGGTTTATASSCYLIRQGGMDGVSLVVNPNSPIEIGTTYETAIEISSASLGVYWTPLQSLLTMQYAGARTVARIVNLTEDSGKGLTDALIYQAMEKFPIGRGPTIAVCSKRSLRQLRASRTATSTTGQPAEIPNEVGIVAGSGGIPIMAVESISDTEALMT